MVEHRSARISFATPPFLLCSGANASPQEHAHHLAHGVMPFDVHGTVHVFKMTESGGIQRVVVKDRIDTDQIILIQQHLRKKAGRFQRGDYSDPATLHGADAKAE
jgi:hypothetical protein